jgi:hypothetical protein
MASKNNSEELRSYLAAIGSKGGKVSSPKKLAHLAKLNGSSAQSPSPMTRARRKKTAEHQTVLDLKEPSDESRRHLASIGAKGGKKVTVKKLAHLSKIQAAGGKTVTPKKLAHLRRMTEARVAKQRAEKAAR